MLVMLSVGVGIICDVVLFSFVMFSFDRFGIFGIICFVFVCFVLEMVCLDVVRKLGVVLMMVVVDVGVVNRLVKRLLLGVKGLLILGVKGLSDVVGCLVGSGVVIGVVVFWVVWIFLSEIWVFIDLKICISSLVWVCEVGFIRWFECWVVRCWVCLVFRLKWLMSCFLSCG